MNKFCPNFSIPAIKARFNELGPEAFYEEYIKNDFQVPNVFENIDEDVTIEGMLFVNKELFDAHQQNSIKNSIVAQVRKYLTEQDTEYVLTSKDIRDTVFADFEISRDYFLESTDVEEQEIGRNLANVVDNFDSFWALANADLNKLGIKQTPVTGIQTDNNTEPADAAYESEDALFQKLNYSDESSFQQSSKDTASAHMKLTLSMVPKYEYENGKVVTYEGDNGEILPLESRNLIGMVEFEPLDVIWNDMLYTMVDIPRGAKIDYLKNSSNPRHQAIYELLEGNQQLQNEFEVTFSKQQAKFITAVARRPVPVKVFNEATNSWVNARDESGKVIYENRTISILDTNRSNPENILVADWTNNFLNTSLVRKDVNGNLFVDTEKGAKLRDFYEQAITDWDIPLLVRVFKTMGIDISEEALSSTGLYTNRELTSPRTLLLENGKFIFDRLAGQLSLPTDIESGGVIEASLEDNNPFLQESRVIDLLARLENKVNPGSFESSFISGDGKAKYSFVNNTYASLQYNKLITSPEYLQKLKTTSYASNSHWLNQLIDNPTFKAHFDFRYVDTLGNDANNQTNKPFGKMNTKEKEYFRLSIFQNAGQTVSKDSGSPFVGYFIGLTPSDKTTLPMFKSMMVRVNANENLVINKAALEVLRNQFISEYNRVATTIEQNSDDSVIKIDKYHGENGMGTKFIMFPTMNKLMFDSQGNLLALDDNRIKDIVNPELTKMAQELIRDQINYWTELGLYNTSIIDKSYGKKVKLNPNNGDTILRNLAANYAINNFIAMMNQTQLFSGDPALHGKPVEIDGDFVQGDSINNTWINYFKRMAKDIAPGLDPNFKNSTLSFDLGNPDLDTSEYFNTIFLKDLNYKSSHLSEYRKIIGDKVDQKGSYGKINPADAQEYTTLREHLVVMKALGKLSPEQEAAGERLINGGSLESDIRLILQPMKPVYVEGVVEDNINKIYYIKTSSFPLIPALTKGLEIDKLRVAMEDNNIQRAVYESGVKLGIQGSLLDISSDGGLTFKDLKPDSKQIINLPRSGFRIQQEIPFHGEDDMVNEGSQGRKLILNNVLDSDIVHYNGLDITGKEAKRIFEGLHIEKMNRAFDAFKADIGVDEATGRITNLDKLAEILRKEAEDRDYPLNDIYSVSIIEEDGVQKFKIPLSLTQSAQRFESILNSIVTNRVIKGELPGFTLVQGAGVGFKKVESDENLADYQSEITWVNPNDTQLNYIREKNGRLSSADILVPNYLRDNEGNLIDISKYVVGGYLATDSIPEELLTIIGIRIPTQGLNSMMKFRVKGFLPGYMGDIAIVPAEVTSQMGSDFDVDKLFFYNYHHRVDKEGNLHKISTELEIEVVDNPLTVEAITSFFESNFDMSKLPKGFTLFHNSYELEPSEIIQVLKGIIDDTVNIGITDTETLENIKTTIVDIVSKLTTGEFNLGTHEEANINFNKLSQKQIDNLIVQMFEDRLSDVNAYADIIEPNGFGLLPEVSEEVSKIGTGATSSVHTFTTREQNKIYEVNSDGKMGCLAYGTKVLMYDGTFKEVQNVEVGDQLMGPDSKPRNVLDLKRGVEQMYWVHQSRGISYRVNESHILSTIYKREALYSKPTINGKRVVDYTKKLHDKIEEVRNITVRDYLKLNKTQKTKYFGYVSGLIEFDYKEVPIDPYYLGLWLGDGSCKDIKEVGNIDPEIIEYLKNNFGIHRSHGVATHVIKNDGLINDKFKTLFNIEKGYKLPKGTKRIPDIYKYNNSEIRLLLLAGLIDSDGHYSTRSKQYEITQRYELIANDIAYLTRSLGFKTTIKKYSTNNKRKDGSIIERYKVSFAPECDIPVLITRKKQARKSNFKNRLHTSITLEKDIVDNYYGFELDGDHLFLLEDFTVTHNTALFSLASTFFKSAQDSKLSLLEGASFKFKNSEGQIVRLNNLYELYNIEGGKRSNVIMYLQSAAVDNAKEQILGNLNINEHTMNVASTMAMLGLTEDFIGYFMSQPVLREFTSAMANKSDIIDGGELSYSTATEILEDIISSKLKGKKIQDIIPVLKGIVYGTEHLKTLLENKSKDPNIEYLPIEPTQEIIDLKEFISDIFEFKILVDFSNLLELSNDIRTLQSAINPDTKGLGTSFASIESKTIQLENLLDRVYKHNIGMLNPFTVYNLLRGENSTSAKAIDILVETRGIYSQVNLYSGNVYNSILAPMMLGVGLAPTEANLRDIYNNFKNYLLSSGEFINTEDVNKVRDSLLYGENNIAARWDAYSKTDKGRKNILTKRIKSKIARNAEDFNGLTANNTPSSSNAQDINNATMYFYDMINSSDAVEKQLAEDIVRYFILTGANFGPSSVGKYINFDILEKYQFGRKARRYSEQFNEGWVESLEAFKDQYFQNNPFKAKSIKLDEFKETFEVAANTPEIVNIEGVASTHLVAYDSINAKPRLYKRVGVSEDGHNVVYTEIEVLGNKQIKKYDFNAEPVYVDTTGDNSRLELPYKTADTAEETADTRANIISANYNLDTGDYRSVLSRIAEISQVPAFKQLANTLLRNTPDSYVVTLLNEITIGNGSYTRNDNTIRINTEAIAGFTNYNDKFEQVFLEELVHALTVNNLLSEEGLSPKQITARNKIVRLYEEYIKNFVDRDSLERYKSLMAKAPEARTSEENAFLRARLNDLYPMTSVAEFVGQGLTKPEFRAQLENNNFWTRLVDLIKNLLGIDAQSDLDFLFTSTMELIETAETQTETDLDSDTSFNIDNLNNFNSNEYNRLKFVEQRDKFLANWKVKDYFRNQHKKYTAETQRKFLEANGKPGYDRIRIEFWHNELRIRRVDPITIANDTSFNVDEEAIPKSREEKFIDRILTKYENTVKRLEDRLKTTNSEAEKGRLSVQLENTRKKLEELKLDRNLIKIVDSIEKRLRSIERLLNSENPNYHELFEAFDYVKEIITLNQEVEFDTGSETGAKYKKKADNLSGKASGMLNKLKDISANMVQEWATTEIDWAVAPDIMGILSQGVKEVNALEAGNLDATQSSNEHIQALQYLIDYAQTKADTNHSEFMKELADIEAEYRKDYGSSYDQLYQLDENGKPTKYLLNKYLDSYYKTTAGDFKAWRDNTIVTESEEGNKAFEEARKAVREVSNDEEYLNWLRDNDPKQYIKDHNSGKKYNSWRHARKYVRMRPIDKWIDPRYTALMERPDTDSAKRMYQFIEPLFRRLNNKYNSGQINYVPELKKDTIKYFTEGNLKGGISSLWEDFSNDIRSDVYITGVTNQSDLDPLTREPRKRIPVRFFGDNLETIDRSTDLARIAEIVMYQEESNKVKHEIEPLLNIYYTLLRDAKQNKGFDPETGDAVVIDKPASKASEQASFIIDGWLYGMYRSTEEAEQKYGKATDALINYVRLKGMAYNPFSAIGNVMQGIMSNFTFAGGGQFFGQNDFLKSTMIMNSTLIGSTANAKKVSKAFMYFDAFVRHNEMNHGQSRELRAARSKYSRWFEPMGLQQSGEYYVQGQTMLGILFKTKVKNLKGESKPIWEAFDNDFNWNVKEFGENPYSDPKKLFNLKMRIRKAIIDVHGNYTRPIMNKKHFYWRLVYTFRTWLPQAITNRFGGERTDILLGDTTKGRYRSYPALWKNEEGQLDWQALKQNVAWLLKLGSKNTLSELDMQNLRKNLSELILLATITAALMLLRAGMDDWDEETKEIWTYAYNNLMRARGDVMFFMDPSAAQTILRDPVAAMSVLNDFIDVMGAGFDTVMGDPVYKAGPRKGQYRLFKETIDNIPFINQVPKNIQYMNQVFISR